MSSWKNFRQSLRRRRPRQNSKPQKVKRSRLVVAQNVASKRAFKTQVKQHLTAFAILLLGGATCFIGLTSAFLSLHMIDIAQTMRLQGRLQAIEQSTPIKHTSSGVVKSIYVSEGEVVREGQILMSLNTEDLNDQHFEARQKVSELLIQAACLRAKRDSKSSVSVNQELRQIIGRLDQKALFHRAVQACEYDLQQDAFDRLQKVSERKLAQDRTRLLDRLAHVSQTLHGRLATLGDVGENDQIEDLRNLNKAKDSLRYSLEAVEAKSRLKVIEQTQAQANFERATRIDLEIERVQDALISAERELTEMETLMQDRFLYASTSGRVQRLRIKDSGTRVAAGAYLLEIAPTQTDFEVLSTASLFDLPDISIGQPVMVQLSGGLPKPVWVPANINQISKLDDNNRLVSIHLTRQELNKRDLLLGDHSVNGLGEQSEATIKIRSENAWNTLVRIFQRQFLPDPPKEA